MRMLKVKAIEKLDIVEIIEKEGIELRQRGRVQKISLATYGNMSQGYLKNFNRSVLNYGRKYFNGFFVSRPFGRHA